MGSRASRPSRRTVHQAITDDSAIGVIREKRTKGARCRSNSQRTVPPIPPVFPVPKMMACSAPLGFVTSSGKAMTMAVATAEPRYASLRREGARNKSRSSDQECVNCRDRTAKAIRMPAPTQASRRAQANAAQSKSHRHQILWMVCALDAEPDGRETGNNRRSCFFFF